MADEGKELSPVQTGETLEPHRRNTGQELDQIDRELVQALHDEFNAREVRDFVEAHRCMALRQQGVPILALNHYLRIARLDMDDEVGRAWDQYKYFVEHRRELQRKHDKWGRRVKLEAAKGWYGL